MFNFDLDTLLYRIIAFVIAFAIHEWAHAFVAYKLGDNTARDQGRLTLNPISHVEPLGMLMILFGPFGWARPVPVNAFHFRGNRRLGMVYVSAAGPIMNLILAVAFLELGVLLSHSSVVSGWPDWAWTLVRDVIGWSFNINVALFVFNLLPVAPLDGSKILRYILPRRYDHFFERMEPYGTFILLLLIFIPAFGALILYGPYRWVQQAIYNIIV
nr:site-2 protease family protein [Aneurinibacillus tyrosinisolvens]